MTTEKKFETKIKLKLMLYCVCCFLAKDLKNSVTAWSITAMAAKYRVN